MKQPKKTMKQFNKLLILIALSCIRKVVPFAPPAVTQRPFGVARMGSKVQTRAAASDGAPSTPKKKEKVTPEARELAQVLLEKEENKSPFKYIVAQTAPSVRVAFSEVFGKEPGEFSADLMVSSLKEIGFDLVLDTNTAADLTICEEGQELLERIMAREQAKETGESTSAKPLPLFTSCCPGWMKLVQKSAPEISPYISTCTSPHMMYGAVLKKFSKELLDCEPHEIYMCSVMPCVRKRGESDEAVFQNNGVRSVDNVITTKDLGAMLQERGIDPLELEPTQYDSPFQSKEAQGSGLGSGAGQLFGATGGVMEAAVRSVYELVTGTQLPRLELHQVRGLEDVKETIVSLYHEETKRGMDMNLRLAVVNGLGTAKKLLAKMKSGEAQYDFVEVMACPAGCIAGAGQPRGTPEDVKKRLGTIYSLDKRLPIRKSHENPVIKALYERHLGNKFGSPQAHEILHVPPVYGGQDEEVEPFVFK